MQNYSFNNMGLEPFRGITGTIPSNRLPAMPTRTDVQELDNALGQLSEITDILSRFNRMALQNQRSLPDLRNMLFSPATSNFSENDDEDDQPSNISSYVTSKTLASSYSSDGSPVYIQKTKVQRKGPGVGEVQKTMKNSRSGKEKLMIKRTLNGKATTIIRERDSSGNETYAEKYQGITEDEVDQFDEDWRKEAEHKLISEEQAGRLLRISSEHVPSVLLPPITRNPASSRVPRLRN